MIEIACGLLQYTQGLLWLPVTCTSTVYTCTVNANYMYHSQAQIPPHPHPHHHTRKGREQGERERGVQCPVSCHTCTSKFTELLNVIVTVSVSELVLVVQKLYAVGCTSPT